MSQQEEEDFEATDEDEASGQEADDTFNRYANLAKAAQEWCINDLPMQKLTKVPDEDVGSYLTIFNDFSVETKVFEFEQKTDDEQDQKLIDRLQQVCDKLKAAVCETIEIDGKELLYILKNYVSPEKILSYCKRTLVNVDSSSAIEQLCKLDDEKFFGAFPLTDTDFVNLEKKFYAHTIAQFEFEQPQIGPLFSGCIRLVLPFTINDPALLKLVKSVCRFNIGVEHFLEKFPIFVSEKKLNWIETNIEILLGKKKNLYVKYYGCLPSQPNVVRLIVSIFPNSQNAAVLIDRCPTAIISAELQTDPNRFNTEKWYVKTRSSIPTFDKYSVWADETTLVKKLIVVLDRPIISSHFDHIILQTEPLVRQLVSVELESKLFIGVTDYVPKLCIIFYNGDLERMECAQKICDFCLDQKVEQEEEKEEEEKEEEEDEEQEAKKRSLPIANISLFVTAKKQDEEWKGYFKDAYSPSQILYFPAEGFKVRKQTKMIITDFVHVVALCAALGNLVSYSHLIIDCFNKCTGLAYTKTLFSTILVSNMILLSPTTKLSSKVLKLLPTTALSNKIFPGVPFDKIANLAVSHCLYYNKDVNDDKFKPELLSERGVSSARGRSRSSRGTSMTRAPSNRIATATKVAESIAKKTVSFHIPLPPSIDEILTNRNPKLFETQRVHYVKATKEMHDFAQQIIKPTTQKFQRLWYDMYAGGLFVNFSAVADLQCSFTRKGRWEVVKNEHVQTGVCGICQSTNSKNPIAVLGCSHTYCSACLLSFINNVSEKHCPHQGCSFNPLKVVLCKNHDDESKIAEMPVGVSSDLFALSNEEDKEENCCDNLSQKQDYLFDSLLSSTKTTKTIIVTEYERVVDLYHKQAEKRGWLVFFEVADFLAHIGDETCMLIICYSKAKELISEKSSIITKDIHIVMNDISPQSIENVLNLNEAFPSLLEFLLYDFGLDRLLFFTTARQTSLIEKDLILCDAELKTIIQSVLAVEDVNQIVTFITAEDTSSKWKDIPKSTYSLVMTSGEIIELQYGANNGHIWQICPFIKVLKFGEKTFHFDEIVNANETVYDLLASNFTTHRRFANDIAELQRMLFFANFHSKTPLITKKVDNFLLRIITPLIIDDSDEGGSFFF